MIRICKIAVDVVSRIRVKISTNKSRDLSGCMFACVDDLRVFNKISFGIPVQVGSNNLQTLVG
jgi:hypothetical protein